MKKRIHTLSVFPLLFISIFVLLAIAVTTGAALTLTSTAPRAASIDGAVYKEWTFDAVDGWVGRNAELIIEQGIVHVLLDKDKSHVTVLPAMTESDVSVELPKGKKAIGLRVSVPQAVIQANSDSVSAVTIEGYTKQYVRKVSCVPIPVRCNERDSRFCRALEYLPGFCRRATSDISESQPFLLSAYVKEKGKKTIQLPLVRGTADGVFRDYSVVLPVLDAMTIESLTIEFRGKYPSNRIDIDSIRLVGSEQNCIQRPSCMYDKPPCAPDLRPGQTLCPDITPTCIPRPPCLDANPSCKMPESINMCPRGCFYKNVQCVKAPCPPILVCPTPSVYTCPQTEWIDCMPRITDSKNDFSGRAYSCSKDYLDWAKANCPNFRGATY